MASEGGLFCRVLIVVHCNDLTVILEGICKAAMVLPALLKVYTIPCHDRGHINVVLTLQSSSDSLHILPSSSSDGLDGPGSNPGREEIIRPSTPAFWPTQPPVK